MEISRMPPILNMKFHRGLDAYSDGETVEQALLRIVKDGPPPLEALKQDNRWPVLYHLSPERRNLLNWFSFESDGTLLEVGAGCGALTGLFCERLARVAAVELSARRCEIIRHRHASCDNLEIIAGDIMDVPDAEKFDYVTLIGVLEYAGAFIRAPDAPGALLAALKRRLKPEGVFIMAIENKFGLKYFAGAREDHTGRPFQSIEDYSPQPGIRTFSRNELERLLRRCGFGHIRFYYPCPDYKLPSEIFSDAFLPVADNPPPPASLNFDAQRWRGFDETAAMENAIKEGLFPLFANSFLVVASDSAAPETQPVYARYNTHRLPQFQTQTTFERRGSALVAVKRALSPQACAHIGKLAELHAEGEKLITAPNLRMPRLLESGPDFAAFEFIAGPSLDKLMFEALMRGAEAEFEKYMDAYRDLLEHGFAAAPRFPSPPPREAIFCGADLSALANERFFMKRAFLDPTPENLVLSEDGIWHFVDNEWAAEGPLPVSYVLYRGLFSFFMLKHSRLGQQRQALFETWLRRCGISEALAGFYRGLEERFQDYVCGEKKEYYIKLGYAQPTLTVRELEDRNIRTHAYVRELLKTVETLDRELSEYRSGAVRLREMLEDSDWRLYEKLRPALKKIFPPRSRMRGALMRVLACVTPSEKLPPWLDTFDQKGDKQ